MFNRLIASLPRDLGKWCGCALVLLAPGSFVILPLLWLIRQFGVHTARRHLADGAMR
jgi:hypothetical protein